MLGDDGAIIWPSRCGLIVVKPGGCFSVQWDRYLSLLGGTQGESPM